MVGLAGKIGAPPELLPMCDYFGLVIGSPITFLGALRSFSQNRGYSVDYHYTEFSLEMHPSEEGYFTDGVRFMIDVPHAYEAEVIVSFQVFYKYLVRVCKIYLEMHPEDLHEVEMLLKTIWTNLEIS
jgi:hypothetical protein